MKLVNLLKIKKKKYYLMKKSNGKLNYNIAIFISGRGSNLKSIIKSSLKKKTLYKVKIVISNRKKAEGLLFAKKMGIKNYFFDFNKSNKIGGRVLNLLKKNIIKLLCLAGFMMILPSYFIKSFNGKLINIRPSLLA
jgi:Folate-dependent phosphoribosylglycinamide formyltransferase PurN